MTCRLGRLASTRLVDFWVGVVAEVGSIGGIGEKQIREVFNALAVDSRSRDDGSEVQLEC